MGGVPPHLEQLDGSKSTELNLANRLFGLSRYLYVELVECGIKRWAAERVA